MLRLGTRNRTMLGVLLLALLYLQSAPAAAMLLDARRMAMGGVSPPRPGRLSGENPAYAIVPERDSRWGNAIPLPFGLFTLLDHPEEFNPNDDAFDPVRLGNLILNPPIHLELREPTPMDGDIVLDLGQEHLRVYWEDAHLILPQDPLNMGGRLERFSLGYGRPLGERGRWRLQVAPYLDADLETALDDAFYGLLAEGDSLKPNSEYTQDGELAALGGFSCKLLLARSTDAGEGGQLFLAAAPKIISGIGMIEGDLELTASSGDSLFSAEAMDVEQVSHTRVSESMGLGFALDLGLVYRRGSWDLGVGVRDLAGSVAFGDTKLERQRLESEDGSSDMITEVLAEGESHSYTLKPFWTFNTGYSHGALLLLGELRLRPWQETLHLGGEYRFSKLALRGGLRRDARERWQFSAGTGIRLAGVNLDLALESHNRYLQDERGLALGMSISL